MRIVVIEDHKLVRDMLVVACRQALPKASISGANTIAEGIALCRSSKPDLVFLDLELPDGDGLDSLPEIKAAVPSVKVVLLTSHAEEFTLHRAIQADVHGFVDKTEQPLEVLQEAIATVMAGRQYFSSLAQRIKTSMHSDPAAFSKILTDSEQEMLRHFGEGLSNEQIADKVGSKPSTVKTHRRNIMAKLDVHTTPELIQYALEKGFAHPRRPIQKKIR